MRRLVVAHMINGPAAKVINMLRKKYDIKTASAIDAHVTLAGPSETDLNVEEIAAIIDRVASDLEPFELTIIGVDTFLPISSTSFLHVEPEERFVAINDKLTVRLCWRVAFPYRPHVTITEYLSPTETSKVAYELCTLNIHETDILDTLALLQKGTDGKWMILREFQLRSNLQR